MSDKMKLIIAGVICGLIAVIFLIFVSGVGAFQLPPFSKTICHHTPANQVTHTFNNLQSYLGHLGTPHSGSTYDSEGACVQPTATPTPTITPTVTPTPTEEEYCEDESALNYKEEGECEYPEVTPEPTPTPEIIRLGLPGDGLSDSKGYSTPVCNGVFPDKPTIREDLYRVTGANSAHFEFWPVKADSYVVEYGYSKDKLDYGIPHLGGDSTGFEVEQLKDGFTSLFARVTAKLGNCFTSSEVAN